MSCSQPLDLGIGGAGKALEPPYVGMYFSRGNPCEQEVEVGVVVEVVARAGVVGAIFSSNISSSSSNRGI